MSHAHAFIFVYVSVNMYIYIVVLHSEKVNGNLIPRQRGIGCTNFKILLCMSLTYSKLIQRFIKMKRKKLSL